MFSKNSLNLPPLLLLFTIAILSTFSCKLNAADKDKDGILDRHDRCSETPAQASVNRFGCEILETITLHLNFDSNSTEVSDEYLEDLGAVASKIQRHFNVKVTVEGHTDWKGKQKDNKPLSEARAKAVAAILQADSGVDENRFHAVGYGELRPIADNLSAAGREKNRRVVIIIERAKDVQY